MNLVDSSRSKLLEEMTNGSASFRRFLELMKRVRIIMMTNHNDDETGFEEAAWAAVDVPMWRKLLTIGASFSRGEWWLSSRMNLKRDLIMNHVWICIDLNILEYNRCTIVGRLQTIVASCSRRRWKDDFEERERERESNLIIVSNRLEKIADHNCWLFSWRMMIIVENQIENRSI